MFNAQNQFQVLCILNLTSSSFSIKLPIMQALFFSFIMNAFNLASIFMTNYYTNFKRTLV